MTAPRLWRTARRPSGGSEPDRCNAGIATLGNRTTPVSLISVRKVNVWYGPVPCLERQGLVCAYPVAHNAVVTITYLDGTVLEAIVLSHEENEIRAIAAGCDDVLAFTRIHGTWISEEIEPVTIEFAWQRRGASPVASEDDCVCPKKLAARLIQSLFRGCEPNEAGSDALYVLSAEKNCVAVRLSELQPR